MDGIVAVVVAVILWFSGGDSGGQNTGQNRQPPANSSEPENAVSVPTPALLPGLIGLGAAALRKRKSAIVTPED